MLTYIVVIISPSIRISNLHAVYLKQIKCYMSIISQQTWKNGKFYISFTTIKNHIITPTNKKKLKLH